MSFSSLLLRLNLTFVMQITGDGMFQIQLKNADVCQPWYKSTHVREKALISIIIIIILNTK